MKGFSIIIPSYNRCELLRSALKSVQQLRLPGGWEAEVLVIDNNSTDHTPAVTEEFKNKGPLPVRHIFETKQGLNHSRNRGIHEASYEHLVYLDDDMLVDPGWLEGYVEAQKEILPDATTGPVEPIFEVTPPEWMTRRMIESVTSAYSQKGDQLIQIPKEHSHELPGCNFAVLKSVAVESGGFHPSLDRCGQGMLAGGDWEFGQRLVSHNKRVVYSPKCRIRHLVSKYKLSREGLLARWEGIGATRGAMIKLQGEKLEFSKRFRLTLRMLRLFGRSYRFRIYGDLNESFRWELESLTLKGLLFKAPSIWKSDNFLS